VIAAIETTGEAGQGDVVIIGDFLTCAALSPGGPAKDKFLCAAFGL
jgi:hypothetical protein